MNRLVMMLLVSCLVAPAYGKVYKLVLPDGSVQFSDQPQEGAEEVKLPPAQTFSPPPVPSTGDRSAGQAQPGSAQTYERVEIASPKPDETVRDNGGRVNVSVSLEPALQPGHTVEILLDGRSIGSGAGTSAALTDVDRGTHSVSAVVKDAEGNTVATASAVTFHLQRVAVGGPRPAPLPGGAGRRAGGS